VRERFFSGAAGGGGDREARSEEEVVVIDLSFGLFTAVVLWKCSRAPERGIPGGFVPPQIIRAAGTPSASPTLRANRPSMPNCEGPENAAHFGEVFVSRSPRAPSRGAPRRSSPR